ncbi:MAG: indole-3-glycerol phosphate synthase TrpC [Alphaproteobacteria bacterium]
MNKLEEICARKRQHIIERKRVAPLKTLETLAAGQSLPRGFQRALTARQQAGEIGLIAEIKKASPSKGIIREDFDPATLADAYQRGGATCLSVLTDEPYFQGQDAYLAMARAVVTLPVLRKDFMLDPYQIVEARALAADCILLIMAALSDAEAKSLEALAQSLGMDVLIEVHDEIELQRALSQLSSRLIGINNRSLKTLNVSLETSLTLKAKIPSDYTVVCESGIASRADIERIRAAGIHCFLVGETLMRAADVTAATRSLLGA